MMGDTILAVAMLAAAFLLTACASCPERPAQVITERVEVPVSQKAQPPTELVTCGQSLALPVSQELPAMPGALVFLPADARILQLLLDGKQTCIEAWTTWGTTQ
jgi:hypothetical protein